VGLLPDDNIIVTDGVSDEVTFMVTVLDVTVTGVAQLAFDVSAQVIESPLANDEEVYVLLLVPTLLPFTCH
jgi:hypothetical protein